MQRYRLIRNITGILLEDRVQMVSYLACNYFFHGKLLKNYFKPHVGLVNYGDFINSFQSQELRMKLVY